MSSPEPLVVDVLWVLAGSRIREAREALGLTQDSLAQLVEVTRESVSAWESGRGVPSGTKLARLATVLKHEPSDFFIRRDLSSE